MMSLQIIEGVQRTPIKTVIYGSEGIGKSTLASKFPNPLFLDTEGGTARLPVRRIVISDWENLTATVKEIYQNPTIAKTVIVDTADWAEALCTAYVCNKYHKANIEEFGFGKGYTYLADEFNQFLSLLTKLTEVGINVVIIAHGKPRKFELPEEQGQFDRWETKLTKQVAPLIKEWCDLLLFCNYKTFVIATENKSKKAQGGKRVMFTTHNPCWDAKNRFGLPDELDLDFKAIAHLFEEPKAEEQPKVEKTETTVERPTITKLKTLIKNAGITEGDLIAVVASRGHYPKDAKITDYSDDFVTRWIVPNWTKIISSINTTKGA